MDHAISFFFIKEGTNKYLKVTDVDGDQSRQLCSHSKLKNFWQNYRFLVCILVSIEFHGSSPLSFLLYSLISLRWNITLTLETKYFFFIFSMYTTIRNDVKLKFHFYNSSYIPSYRYQSVEQK